MNGELKRVAMGVYVDEEVMVRTQKWINCYDSYEFASDGRIHGVFTDVNPIVYR